MRPWIVAIATVAVLSLAGCDYGPTDVGYRPPKPERGQTGSASSGHASSGTSNGGDVAIEAPKAPSHQAGGAPP